MNNKKSRPELESGSEEKKGEKREPGQQSFERTFAVCLSC